MDRRKRILRENLPVDDESASSAPARSRTRRGAEVAEESDEPTRRRSAGYSQDVRRACQHRLVQLIPVRRRAYLTAVVASCVVPVVLLVLHYWIYVNGFLNWYGQPLAVLLDASHPRGIAAWLSGQAWLLCLASTVLTFQLRKHKLDDFTGDYRLWFWLVSTCVIGSLDSTTRVIDIFGDALNRWSTLNLGWSGPAVVQATLAALIGMLGVRLCSELKAVPTSLVFWLVGLVAWAGSAALSQEMLKLEMTIQLRIWLRSALWLGGLTSIWLASLSYLRYVYIEAQRRFLLRGRLAASVSSTWRERITESMPAMPSMPKFRLRRPTDEAEQVEVTKSRRTKTSQPDLQVAAPEIAAKRRFGLPSFMKRKSQDASDQVSGNEAPAASTARSRADAKAEQRSEQSNVQSTTQSNVQSNSASNGPLSQARRMDNAAANTAPNTAPRTTSASPATNASTNSTASKSDDAAKSETTAKRSWFGSLMSKSAKSDDAPEYRKIEKAEKAAQRAAEKLAAKEEKSRLAEERRQSKTAAKSTEAGAEPGAKRGWLPKLPQVKMPKMPSVPKPRMPKLSLPKLSLPKLKLPSLRLPPPESTGGADNRTTETRSDKKPDIRPLPATKPLPTTNGPAQQAIENGARPLSKAERKRLRRMQDDGDYEAEDRRAA